MTIDEVKERVHLQAGLDLELTNDHGITLKQALVPPQKITIIDRLVRNGRLKDRQLDVWLVGQKNAPDGYRIIMGEDGLKFGLAANGFPTDGFLILTGWYGNLVSTFLAM